MFFIYKKQPTCTTEDISSIDDEIKSPDGFFLYAIRNHCSKRSILISNGRKINVRNIYNLKTSKYVVSERKFHISTSRRTRVFDKWWHSPFIITGFFFFF